MKKKLIDISLQISEKEYRKLSALSYSMLSKFDRKGIKAILFPEKEETPSLRFGSLVDTLLTEPEKMDDLYFVLDVPHLSDTIINIMNNVYHLNKDKKNPSAYTDEQIQKECDAINYQPNWKNETKVKKVLEVGLEYYETLVKIGEKQVVSSKHLQQANECVETLKNNKFTQKYFTDEVFADVESYNQLKFACSYGKDVVKCMFDRIIVDYKNKTIQPIDLKTTGENERYFFKSFLDYRYHLQASLYSHILQKLCAEDDYFKDFKILPFKFICINKYSKAPLIWNTPEFVLDGLDLATDSGYQIKGFRTLIDEYNWHIKTGNINYTKDTYLAEGEMQFTKLKLA